MPYFIRSGSLTSFTEVALQAGLDPTKLMQEFGLPQGCLAEPDVMVPAEAVARLLEAAAARSGLEAFGLLMAESRKVSSLGPLGLFAREQPTLRDAVVALAHYARMLNQSLTVSLEEAGEVAVLREELLVGEEVSVRQARELAVGVLYTMIRSFLGPDWRPHRVCFVHEAPRDTAVHARVLGRHVHFGQDFNGIVCARRDLSVANPNADPTVARYARQLLEIHTPTESERFSSQVRQLVVLQLGSGRSTIERVAHMLRVDRRTIHRRLLEESQTFTDILDSVRRELATSYLEDTSRSVAQVSGLLGFSAPSGFSRWYRHQFGQPASRTRAPRRTIRPD